MKKTNSRAGKTVKLAEEISASMPAPNEELTSTTEPAPVPQTKEPIHIPPILLEGDESPEASKPPQTQKYTVGPTPMVERFEPESRELPEAYGTGKLLLTPRDPHWLYAHWDLSREQQRAYNERSAHGHLVVRVLPQEQGASAEVHLHPESRHWFVEVGRAGTSYVAELGYYQTGDEWVSISTSAAARTPPDQVSEDKTVQFATRGGKPIPREQLLAANAPQATDQEKQTQGIIPPRVEWLPALDPQVEGTVPVIPELSAPTREGESALLGKAQTESEWTSTQEAALSELASMQSVRQGWISSFEITESIRHEIEREIASAQFGRPPQEANPVSSPMGGPLPRVKAFWFNVNADLIIYGATQPDATVMIGGQPIQLRPDGTFSCRLALPDGEYELEVAATSVESDFQRAQLKFSRRSRYDEAITNPE